MPCQNLRRISGERWAGAFSRLGTRPEEAREGLALSYDEKRKWRCRGMHPVVSLTTLVPNGSLDACSIPETFKT